MSVSRRLEEIYNLSVYIQWGELCQKERIQEELRGINSAG